MPDLAEMERIGVTGGDCGATRDDIMVPTRMYEFWLGDHGNISADQAVRYRQGLVSGRGRENVSAAITQ